MTSDLYEVDYSKCPPDLEEGFRRYVDGGVPTGGFLRAVLENDLSLAVKRADLVNRRRIHDVVRFLDELPPVCWGSKRKVEGWLELHAKARGT